MLTLEQQKNLEPFERTALVYPAREYFSESNLHQQIQTALKKQFKDQKVVEIETAEAIATKVSNWAKLLGFFVGIPLALLVFVLGFLDIKNYRDLETELQQAKTKYQSLEEELTSYELQLDNLGKGIEIVRVLFGRFANYLNHK